MQIVKTVVAGSAAAILLVALPASAQDRTKQLRGDYAITGTAVCTSSPAGFSPSLVPLGASSESSFGTTGVATFNGDGNGTLSGRTITQPGSVQALDTAIPLTYTVAADRTLTVVQGPSLNTFVAGTLAGQQNSSSGVPPFVGHLSSDRKSIVFGSFDPAVETITNLSGPGQNQRVCFRSFTGIRVSTPNDDDN